SSASSRLRTIQYARLNAAFMCGSTDASKPALETIPDLACRSQVSSSMQPRTAAEYSQPRTTRFLNLGRDFWNNPPPARVSDRVSLTGEGTLRGREMVHIIQTDDAGRPGLSSSCGMKKPWTIHDLSEPPGRRSGAILPTTADVSSSWCWEWQT